MEVRVNGDNFCARLGMDFTTQEVADFLEKLGYIVIEHSAPSYQRIDGMYDNEPRMGNVMITRKLALKPGQEPPKLFDYSNFHETYNMSADIVFLTELKRKLLKL